MRNCVYIDNIINGFFRGSDNTNEKEVLSKLERIVLNVEEHQNQG